MDHPGTVAHPVHNLGEGQVPGVIVEQPGESQHGQPGAVDHPVHDLLLHVGQADGAQLGPPAAAVAQTHDHMHGHVIEKHVGQTGWAQLGPRAAAVAQTDMVAEVILG